MQKNNNITFLHYLFFDETNPQIKQRKSNLCQSLNIMLVYYEV